MCKFRKLLPSEILVIWTMLGKGLDSWGRIAVYAVWGLLLLAVFLYVYFSLKVELSRIKSKLYNLGGGVMAEARIILDDTSGDGSKSACGKSDEWQLQHCDTGSGGVAKSHMKYTTEETIVTKSVTPAVIRQRAENPAGVVERGIFLNPLDFLKHAALTTVLFTIYTFIDGPPYSLWGAPDWLPLVLLPLCLVVTASKAIPYNTASHLVALDELYFKKRRTIIPENTIRGSQSSIKISEQASTPQRAGGGMVPNKGSLVSPRNELKSSLTTSLSSVSSIDGAYSSNALSGTMHKQPNSPFFDPATASNTANLSSSAITNSANMKDPSLTFFPQLQVSHELSPTGSSPAAASRPLLATPQYSADSSSIPKFRYPSHAARESSVSAPVESELRMNAAAGHVGGRKALPPAKPHKWGAAAAYAPLPKIAEAFPSEPESGLQSMSLCSGELGNSRRLYSRTEDDTYLRFMSPVGLQPHMAPQNMTAITQAQVQQTSIPKSPRQPQPTPAEESGKPQPTISREHSLTFLCGDFRFPDSLGSSVQPLSHSPAQQTHKPVTVSPESPFSEQTGSTALSETPTSRLNSKPLGSPDHVDSPVISFPQVFSSSQFSGRFVPEAEYSHSLPHPRFGSTSNTGSSSGARKPAIKAEPSSTSADTTLVHSTDSSAQRILSTMRMMQAQDSSGRRLSIPADALVIAKAVAMAQQPNSFTPDSYSHSN